MILKGHSWFNLIINQFIYHLKLIKTFIFTIERTNRNSINLTIIIGWFSTINTPAKLATKLINLIFFLIFQIFKPFNISYIIWNNLIISNLIFFFNIWFDCNLITDYSAIIIADRFYRDIVLVSDKFIIETLFIWLKTVTDYL